MNILFTHQILSDLRDSPYILVDIRCIKTRIVGFLIPKFNLLVKKE